MMKTDEQLATTPESPPSPQESVKDTDAAKVTPLIKEEIPEAHESNTPGVLVLQWLTYAFWGWMVVGVAYLVSITANFILDGERFERSIEEPVAYGIAAVLVLLPVALLCDIFYSKLEVEHKKGASTVIMVIHAVLFALLGIGTLIAIAFSLVNMLLSGYGTSPRVVLITSIVLFVLYMLALLRTVRPFLTRKFRLIFRVVMSAIVAGACIWGIVGPVAAAARTKDDRAVNQAVTALYSGVNAYVNKKNELPKDINAVIDARDEYGTQNWESIKDVAKRGLVTYTPNTKPPADDGYLNPDISIDSLGSSSTSIFKNPKSKTYFYELCATYKYAGTDSTYQSSYPTSDKGEYRSSIPRTSHTAGKNCYKLKTVNYTPY